MQSPIVRKLENSLAALGTLACFLVTIFVWAPIAANQPMWPLPVAYLVELPLVCLAGMLAIFWGRLTWLAWAAAGILLSFAALGALTIGLAYVPAMLLLLAAAGVATYRGGQHWAVGVGVFAAAAFVQACLIIALINVIFD